LGPRIAVLGGGNGISTVLSGFANEVRKGRPLSIAAVVATADDGGGRLRQERRHPTRDLAHRLLASPEGDEPFRRLFAHRYAGQGICGHSLGNLMLAAMAEISALPASDGDGGEPAGRGGSVLPVTLEPVRLEAETGRLEDFRGVANRQVPSAIHRVRIEPPDAPRPAVLEAIREADLVVLGPGSLFTSLLAVALVPGVGDAIRASRGRRVLVANLMTQPGETLGMDLTDHLDALDRHVGGGLAEAVLVHGAEVDPERVRPYEVQGSDPIAPLCRTKRSEEIVPSDVVSRSGKIRHDPDRLTRALLALVERPSGSRSAVST
jgi:uncharacterized cofD-like protein